MHHNVKVNIVSGAVVLALGLAVSLITSVAVASNAYKDRSRQARRAEQTITVKGSARQRITSDLAVWAIGVSGEGTDLKKAFADQEKAAEAVRAFLTAQGFKDAEVSLSAIETSAHYERDEHGGSTRKVEGYTLSRRFTVSTADVKRAEGAAAVVTELLKEGLRVESSAPRFYYTKLPDLKVAILGDASKDARSRADEIARNAGSVVGEVRSARMGVLQVVSPHSTEVSGEGVYDTATIDKDVTAVVSLEFEVSAK
ncbi:MAG: SIMPL domain-containing protein [Phycisphaerales bacterium]